MKLSIKRILAALCVIMHNNINGAKVEAKDNQIKTEKIKKKNPLKDSKRPTALIARKEIKRILDLEGYITEQEWKLNSMNEKQVKTLKQRVQREKARREFISNELDRKLKEIFAARQSEAIFEESLSQI